MKWYWFVILVVSLLGVSLLVMHFSEGIFNQSNQGTTSNTASQKSETQSPSTKSSTSSKNKVKTIPLTDSERQKVEEALLSSEFIKDIPKKNPISIRFYYFENGSRVWQDRFYMSNGELIESTETGMEIVINSKYIDDLSEKELCSVVQDARSKGDLGTRTDYSETQLMWKYKSMLKHKDCFGI